MFATEAGPELLALTGFPTVALGFDTTFSLGYWTLRLMPLVVEPIMVPLFKKATDVWFPLSR